MVSGEGLSRQLSRFSDAPPVALIWHRRIAAILARLVPDNTRTNRRDGISSSIAWEDHRETRPISCRGAFRGLTSAYQQLETRWTPPQSQDRLDTVHPGTIATANLPLLQSNHGRYIASGGENSRSDVAINSRIVPHCKGPTSGALRRCYLNLPSRPVGHQPLCLVTIAHIQFQHVGPSACPSFGHCGLVRCHSDVYQACSSRETSQARIRLGEGCAR